jgi:hypothetical protein
MDRKMEMVQALESHYRSIMNRYALDINTLIEKADSESLDLLIDSVQKYSHIMTQFNFAQKLKENILKEGQESKKDEN